MKRFLTGFVLGILALIAGVWVWFATGHASVAVTDPNLPFERLLARTAIHARLKKETPRESPVPADEPNLLAGAKIYKDHCAVCHGLPDQPKTFPAAGMFPPPPQLFRGIGVTDDPAWESYWKAANGIRMTGMPGFKEKLTDAQLWQVSQLLAHADKLPDSVKRELVPPAAPPH